MKLLFITDNYPPEVNAPASRTFEHISIWKEKQDVEITVITCFPNFPKGKLFTGYKNKLFSTEYVEGVRIIRVWTYIAPNSGIFRRLADFISFAFSSSIAGLFLEFDLVIATSPQFFTTFAACFLSKVKNKSWIFELRDLWPEKAFVLLDASHLKLISSFFERIELFLYKDCNLIIALTNSYKENLIDRGINSQKIKVITNGVNLNLFGINSKNKTLKNDKKFTVGYIGTHGISQGLDFILNAISICKLNDIHFLFIGDGACKKQLVKLAKTLHLKNVRFIDTCERKKIPNYYSLIDVALVCLKKDNIFKRVIPSKIFEASAMGKPILLGVDGEAKDLVKKYSAGIYYEPEDYASFKKNIYLIKKELSNKKFEDGCKMLANDFSREKLANKMFNYIYELYENRFLFK